MVGCLNILRCTGAIHGKVAKIMFKSAEQYLIYLM